MSVADRRQQNAERAQLTQLLGTWEHEQSYALDTQCKSSLSLLALTLTKGYLITFATPVRDKPPLPLPLLH